MRNDDDNISIMGYIGYGVLTLAEITFIPYYQLESAYYRAKLRTKLFGL